jgi:hypothetical protein
MEAAVLVLHKIRREWRMMAQCLVAAVPGGYADEHDAILTRRVCCSGDSIAKSWFIVRKVRAARRQL